MPNRTALRLIAAGVGLALTAGGCPIADFSGVTLEIVNDTGFDVAPHVVFDNDDNFLAAVFPSEELSSGLIPAGGIRTFEFDCDALGLLFADNAEQLLSDDEVALADDSDTIFREDDYQCGDVIRLRFLGEGVDFGVVVLVNGRVVD